MHRHLVLSAVPGLLIASLLLSSCAPAPAESENTDNVMMLDRLDVSRVISNRANAKALIPQPLADPTGRLSSAAAGMLATNDGVEVLGFIISCAMPADVTLVGAVGNADVEFLGEFGLAPQWRNSALDLAGQRWVSACVLARVNGHSVVVPFSARGPHLGLAANADERAALTLEEGAFYGNLFVPLSQPIQWFACRGRDQATGGASVADRVCATPDPAKPGLTKCGFTFTGDCGDVAVDHACESFSVNGTYYKRCHTTPGHDGQWTGDVFEQVITTFLQE